MSYVFFAHLYFLPLYLSQMQSLTSCQCSVCCGCFQQHFTIAVRDKHIRDMVCPVCWEPDINDPEHLNSYFSTLDIQVGNQINCWMMNEEGNIANSQFNSIKMTSRPLIQTRLKPHNVSVRQCRPTCNIHNQIQELTVSVAFSLWQIFFSRARLKQYIRQHITCKACS